MVADTCILNFYIHVLTLGSVLLYTVQTALLSSATFDTISSSFRVTREHGHFLARTRDECYLQSMNYYLII